MTEITNIEAGNNASSEDDGRDTWEALLDALPAEIHNRMHGVKLLMDPRWVGVEERGQALFLKGDSQDRARALDYLVKGVNDKGTDAPDWGGTVLQAVAGFDVDMVRELLAAGVRADHLYCCHVGGRWDIASYALFVFAERTRLFGGAAVMWAAKCAEIVALSVQAGGPSWVNAWLGAEVAPVLALLRARGITLTGTESWRELSAELEWTDGQYGGDAVCRLLDEHGWLCGESVAFECEAAQARFDAALDAWLDGVGDCGEAVGVGSAAT
jgi:hypothetical protein